MSWMDSWSRPSKHTATPPPLYLLPGGESTPYCHRCGRVIGSRRVQTSKRSKDGMKYCSERCRHRKPGETDRVIEETFVSLLDGGDPPIMVCSPNGAVNTASSLEKDKAAVIGKKAKGEPRVTILCGAVEELVFGPRHDSQKVFGRKKKRAKRGAPGVGDWKSVDMEDRTSPTREDRSESLLDGRKQHTDIILQDDPKCSAPFGAGNARPAQKVSDVSFSVGGERGWAEKIEETDEFKKKRLEGQRKADEREAVRCAARRLCAFGIAVLAEAEHCEEETGSGKRRQKKIAPPNVDDGSSERIEKRKKCEALLKEGSIVEASFAKGEWGIRWRE
jgi:hypothetical protein